MVLSLSMALTFIGFFGLETYCDFSHFGFGRWRRFAPSLFIGAFLGLLLALILNVSMPM
jgi:CIC family chloride channel protein